MTRASAAACVVLALLAGLALRLARLDVRPMHHDEANQGVKFGALLERGEYRYDAHDHHGPTLYFLTLPSAWLSGRSTLASIDERTLRVVPVFFGVATILLLPLLGPAIGREAVAASAVLLAVSPAMVFYSRMYIQESMFAFFTLAFTIALGRAATEPGLRWPLLAGLAAGLAIATKETSAIVLPAAVVACVLARLEVRLKPDPTDTRGVRLQADLREARLRPDPTEPDSRGTRMIRVSVGIASAAFVAALFYSSFLTDPAGVLGPFSAVGDYFDRGTAPVTHVQPWHYYLGLLTWSNQGGLSWTEGLVLLLALVGVVGSWRQGFWGRYLVLNAAIVTAIFSAIPYKTPWNLLPFYVLLIVLAGVGFSHLVRCAPLRSVRAALVLALLAVSGHLAWQAWRASVVYASDPRNPYVYAHTVPDAVRMAARIRALAALHPDGALTRVSVIAPPHEQWPLPWYLRSMPNVGYWTELSDPTALTAPIVVGSMDRTAALDAALGDRYVSEFFGLRPEVLLALYVERALWERYLVAAGR
jgi:uncharacterized protein (TIGR03663 family)